MLSGEELRALSAIDPELEAHLKENPFPGVAWHDLEKLRSQSNMGAERVEAGLKAAPHDDLDEYVQEVTARDGHILKNWVIRSKTPAPSTGRPLILLIHGGGFLMGNNVTQVPLARPLARLHNAVVVTLQYRFAPEHVFPKQQEDIIDNVTWLATNAATIGANPAAGFVIGGSSAGGQLSAVVAQYLADEGFTPKLTGLWQNITVVLAEGIVPEKYREHWISRKDPNMQDAIILSSKDVGFVDAHWKPDYHSRFFSPFNSKTPHKGVVQRAYFQVSGQDPLRDDSLVYEDVLKEAGVATKLDMYPGVPHGFNSLLPNLKLSTKWKIDFMVGISWLLGKEVTAEQLKALAA